jgi:hypothetical protein
MHHQLNKRNIGQEILESIKEIKAWQQGKKQLKTALLARRKKKKQS